MAEENRLSFLPESGEIEHLLGVVEGRVPPREAGIAAETVQHRLGGHIAYYLRALATVPEYGAAFEEAVSRLQELQAVSPRAVVKRLAEVMRNVRLAEAPLEGTVPPAERLYRMHGLLQDLLSRGVELPGVGAVSPAVLGRMRRYRDELRALVIEAAQHREDLRAYRELMRLQEYVDSGVVALEEIDRAAELERRLRASGALERIERLQERFIKLLGKYGDVEGFLRETGYAAGLVSEDIEAAARRRHNVLAGILQQAEEVRGVIRAALEEVNVIAQQAGVRGLEGIVFRSSEQAERLAALERRHMAVRQELARLMRMLIGERELVRLSRPAFEAVMRGEVEFGAGEVRIGGRPYRVFSYRPGEVEAVRPHYERLVGELRAIEQEIEKVRPAHIPRLPHGEVTGLPYQVEEAVERATGTANLFEYYERVGRELERSVEEAAGVAEAVEEYGPGRRTLERMRQRMAAFYSPATPERVEEMLGEWEKAARQGRRVWLRGSAVPYDIVRVGREGVVLKPASVSFSQVEAVVRLAPGADIGETEAEVQRILARLTRAEVLASGTEQQVAGVPERAFRGASAEAVGAELERILGGSERMHEELRRIAVSSQPWLARLEEPGELGEIPEGAGIVSSSSYVALAETLAESGVTGGLTRERVEELLQDERFRAAYTRRLLRWVFGEIGGGQYNPIQRLFEYARETLGLSEYEAAELVRQAARDLAGLPGMEHLAGRIAGMTPREIIREAHRGGLETNIDSLVGTKEEGALSRLPVAGEGPVPYEVERSLAQFTSPLEEEVIREEDLAELRRFVAEHRGEIEEIESATAEEARRRYAELARRFREETGLEEELLRRYIVDRTGRLVLGGAFSLKFAGLREAEAAQALRDLLEVRRALGGRVAVEFFVRTPEGRLVPAYVAPGREDVLGVNLMTGERFVIGEGQTVTVPVTTRVLVEAPPRVLEPIKEEAQFRPVRSLGAPLRSLLAGSAWERVERGDVPDITMAAFRRLRTMRPGERFVLAGFDWETTTLPDRPEPFYPTEVGFLRAELERAPEGYSFGGTGPVVERIVIRPSEEVRREVERLAAKLEGQLRRGAVSLERSQFEFLKNIAKFADSGILELRHEIVEETVGEGEAEEKIVRVRLERAEARRLVSATRRGLAFLEREGVPLWETLDRLAGLMEEARRAGGRRLVVFGQNVLGAEYSWGRRFAQLIVGPVRPRFLAQLEEFFGQPRIELMYLDRLMAPAGARATAEAQLERYVLPVLQGRQELGQAAGNLVRATNEYIRRLGHAGLEGIAHRGAEDILAELAILVSHLGRELPPGADFRPLRRGEFVIRWRAPRMPGSPTAAEEGRPVRGVYIYRGVESVPESGGLALILERAVPGERGRLVGSGETERLYAPNALELARRFHEQFEYATPRRAVAAYRELLEDYARREVQRAVAGPARLAELFMWERFGLPSPQQRAERRPSFILARRLSEAAEKAQRSAPLTAAEEFLLRGLELEQPRDVTVETLAEEVRRTLAPDITGTGVTRLRREAWPLVERWLREEGQAYRQILEDVARFRAIGVLREQPAELFRRVEDVRRAFIESREELQQPRMPVPHLYTLGTFMVGGRPTGELVVSGRSLGEMRRRLERFFRREAERLGASQETVESIVVGELQRRGLLAPGEVDINTVAVRLYRAAAEGRLGPREVEARHEPVLTTPELREEFVREVRRRVIYPALTFAVPGGELTEEAVESYIRAHPLYGRRAELYERAAEELRRTQLHLHPFVLEKLKPLAVEVGAAGAPGVTPEEAAELVERLRAEAERARQAARARRGAVVRQRDLSRGGQEALQRIYEGLSEEIAGEAGEGPFMRALGWLEEDRGRALIPAFLPQGLAQEAAAGRVRDIFMRPLGELSAEELRGLSAVFASRRHPVLRRLSGMMEQYAAELERRGASPGALAVREINEARKEEAARRAVAEAAGAPASTVAEATRRVNRAFIEAGREAGPMPLTLPRAESLLQALKRNWKLLAGLGAAAAGVALLLRHDDREDVTAEDAERYARATKPPGLGPAREAAPYNRPAPADERQGLRVRIRGRTRGDLRADALSDAIGRSVNEELGINTNISVRMQDDRTAVNEQFARDVFAQLLKYGYVRTS